MGKWVENRPRAFAACGVQAVGQHEHEKPTPIKCAAPGPVRSAYGIPIRPISRCGKCAKVPPTHTARGATHTCSPAPSLEGASAGAPGSCCQRWLLAAATACTSRGWYAGALRALPAPSAPSAPRRLWDMVVTEATSSWRSSPSPVAILMKALGGSSSSPTVGSLA